MSSLKYALHHALEFNQLHVCSFSYYACVQVQLAAKTTKFLGGSVVQKTYFLKIYIMELKIALNFKAISLSHQSEIQ